MTVSTVDTLGAYGHELLDACIDALDTTTAGAPDYRLFSPGIPVFDCPDALYVHVAGLGEEQTQPGVPSPVSGRRTQFGQVILATLIVTVQRCVPTIKDGGSFPAIADIEAVADQVNQDLWAIWNHLYHLIRHGQIFDGKCSINHFDTGAPLAISGGTAGWTFQVRPQINGYEPAVSS